MTFFENILSLAVLPYLSFGIKILKVGLVKADKEFMISLMAEFTLGFFIFPGTHCTVYLVTNLSKKTRKLCIIVILYFISIIFESTNQICTGFFQYDEILY